jgi:hypothetical protein
MLNQTIIFICEILQKVIAIGIPYGLVHIIWMPNKKYMFSIFVLCCIYVWKYFYLEFWCTCFLETYFKLLNWRFLEIIYVDVAYIKIFLLISY